jgi:hypothetical protein
MHIIFKRYCKTKHHFLRKLSSPLKNQKGAVLLLTFIIMVSLTTIAIAYVSLVTYNTKNVGGQNNNKKAFYLAMSGLNKAVHYVVNTAPDSSTDGSWRTTAYPAAPGVGNTDPQQENLGEGTYTMWVETPIPPAFDYAMYSGNNIDFQKSSSTTITGDIALVGSLKNEKAVTITGTTTESSTVVFPTVDNASYKGIASVGQDISGDKTFTAGTYSGIWYIDGDVIIEDNVTINGTVVATGSIKPQTITVKKKEEKDPIVDLAVSPTDSYPALVSTGDIDLEEMSDSTITGLVFSGGKIILNDCSNCTFTGSLVASNDIEPQSLNDVTITYDSDITSNPPPYFVTPGVIRITARGTVNNIVRIVRQFYTYSTDLGAFEFAMHAGDDLDFNKSSGSTITGDVGAAGSVKNASSVTITGTEMSKSGVTYPTVTMASYKAIASTGQDISGNKTFTSGTYSGIWYIDGEVIIEDDVTINGSVIATGEIGPQTIIVKKKEQIDPIANLTVTPTDNYPAFVSSSNINLETMETSTITGLIYSGGQIILNECSSCTFPGTLISSGDILAQELDNTTITYDSDIISNQPPYFSDGYGANPKMTSNAKTWEEL